ncbi:hypothetical protein GCK72_009224 [Caenorhabditis remanei]|uniref:Uncharacterized protein n=1 Tax=Caenorhabditis remanei TaxID=31234 RepID=A0A6A5H1S7_CAERE|nr:hypothetical protein GCK72_009224 [Caenorhabditis remanei]KAF1760971.1 hypothetical protein GCK72_009224 [Caenorhabditis remanei]
MNSKPEKKENDKQNLLEKILEKIKELYKKVCDYFTDSGSGSFESSESVVPTTGQITKHGIHGFIIGLIENLIRFVVKVGGPRASNIVTIYDLNSISSLGNPKWYARVDMPHTNVPYHHINVNKAVTGLPDPHIPISAFAAETAGTIGRVLEILNTLAPYLIAFFVAYDVYLIGRSAAKDYKNRSSRNTIKTIIDILMGLLGGYGGYFAGAAIGTAIFPGIGTLVGGLIGGVAGGIAVGTGGHITTEMLMDLFRYDIDDFYCAECGEEFENRRYLNGIQEKCKKCRRAVKSVTSR